MSEGKSEKLEEEAAAAEKEIEQRQALRSPGVYNASEVSLSLGDRLLKMYFAIKRDLPSDNDNLRHSLDSIGTSIELGPRYYETVALLLKSVYDQVKIDAVKAKISDMYFFIKGASLEKKS